MTCVRISRESVRKMQEQFSCSKQDLYQARSYALEVLIPHHAELGRMVNLTVENDQSSGFSGENKSN
jgi:hypothetical protein